MIKVLIIGSNHFVEQESSKIINSIDEADIETYFGDELNKNESDFFSFVNSVSLFGNQKIAYIRNAHDIKGLDNFIKSLESCIETNLILTGDKNSIKDAEKLVKNTSFNLIKEKIIKPTPNQVIEIFKKKNLDISLFNARIIFDMCQGNMVMIENEAEKLAIYKYSNQDIPISELIEFASGEKQEPIYKITDAFSARRTREAFKIYSSIQKNNENLRSLFFALSKRAYNLYYSYFSDKLINENQDFVIKNISDHRRLWTKREVSNLITNISKFDIEIKTGLKQVENAINEILTISNIKNSY